MISRIVNNNFHWIFRRNNLEYDFGIDAYIDIVTDEGDVTGQTIAVQIKTGESFFKQKESKGFVFYGEKKHLNYYYNIKHPTLIILCNPKDESCYWWNFDTERILITEKGWKTIVESDKIFDLNCKSKFIEMVGPILSIDKEIEENSKFYNTIIKATHIHYTIRKNEIESQDTKEMENFFERLQMTDELCRSSKGKVVLSIFGYNYDERELFEIPEVVNWVKEIEAKIKYWFFFCNTDKNISWLPTLMACLCEGKKENNRNKKIMSIDIHPDLRREFFLRNFAWQNEIMEKL